MSIKTFDHAVVYDGIFYPANTPIKTAKIETAETKTVEKVVEKAVDNDDNNKRATKSTTRNRASK